MLREEASDVIEYLQKGGYLTDEINQIINDNIDKDEEKSLKMFPVKGYEDVKKLMDYTVYGITETSSEQGDTKGYNFTFRSELPGCGLVFRNLLVSADGGIYISDVY